MPGDAPYCDDDAMRAIGTCTAAAAAAWFTGGVLTIAAGIGCVGALDGYVECLNQERASRKP
jgi:hypothetical protein